MRCARPALSPAGDPPQRASSEPTATSAAQGTDAAVKAAHQRRSGYNSRRMRPAPSLTRALPTPAGPRHVHRGPAGSRGAPVGALLGVMIAALAGCEQAPKPGSATAIATSASAESANSASSAVPLTLPQLPTPSRAPTPPAGDARTLLASCGPLAGALPAEAEREARGVACTQLAVLYSTGEAGEVNHEQAFKLREHACRLGNSDACVLAGAALASGDGSGKPADVAAAVSLYTKACADKQAEGCLRVGAAHHLGQGAEKSPTKALRAFTQACEYGNAAACFNAGTMEEAGEGEPADAGAAGSAEARYARAITHYGMACSGGFPSGCYNLALVYDRGVITAERPEWAAELYRRGCDAHHPGACGGLGGLLYTGRGVAQDTTRGHEMMQDACAKGSDWGCRLIRKHVGAVSP